MAIGTDQAAVQLVLGRLDMVTAGEVVAAFLRCAGALRRKEGVPMLRVLVTDEEVAVASAVDDVVVVLRHGAGRQEFPANLRASPIRLRAPITPLSLRMALEHALNQRVDRVAGPPDPARANQASERLVADSRPSRPASMSKVTA
jgi:hypothetical protein